MKWRAILAILAFGGLTAAARADPAPAPAPNPAPDQNALGDPGALGGRSRLDIPLGGTFTRADGSVDDPLVRGGIDDRPYLARLGSAATHLAIGGYFDLVGSYVREDGVDNGWSWEMRRFNIFITSRIADAIRLTSEVEFQDGASEIELETALVDILFHHAVNLRAGILLAPIGKFNIAHDSPLYDVVDRPLVSTLIIPATLSSLGAGFFGTLYPGRRNKLTYEIYTVNGLNDGVISPTGTSIPAGKSESAFAASSNGVPWVVGRVAFVSPASQRIQGEVGASALAGIYNTFKVDGLTVEPKRWLRIVALDGDLSWGRVRFRGETAFATVDLPPGLTALHARQQWGFYTEADVRIFEHSLGLFQRATFGAVTRLDYVNLHVDPLDAMGTPAGDKQTRITVGPWFRPAPGTSLRVMYFHDWISDLLGNPTPGGGVEVGLATYY
jgi:hypothetical protein